jgi:hypothetical protein
MEDGQRPTVSDKDGQLYTLDVHQVQLRFDAANLPRSVRSITRYCKSQRLDATIVDGPTGPEWRISEPSVVRAIDELKRAFSLSDTAGHGEPRPDMTELQPSAENKASEPDTSRTLADSDRWEREVSGYVGQLEKRIEEKDDVIALLKGQLVAKDEQINRHSERERETNLLIRGLQNLVLRLQPGRPQNADVFDGDPLMTGTKGENAAA